MNTYMTFWHYGALAIIGAIFIAASLITLQQSIKTSNKISVIIAYLLTTIGMMYGIILLIDTYTKKITLSDVKDRRFLPTEKIFFTGSVRNSGDYIVGKVRVEIKIINRDTAAKKGEPSYQSNAFAELLGDDPTTYKPSYLITTEIVATNLKPGQRKNFHITMPHPPHFKGYTVYPRVIVE
jgi:hypothetical protein